MGFNVVTPEMVESQLKSVEQDSKGSGRGGSKLPFFNLPKDESKTWVRFLPPVGEMKEVGKRVWTHFKLPNNELRTIKCFKTYNRDCAICNLLDEYKKKYGYTDDDKSPLKDWFSVLQTNFNVLIARQEIKGVAQKVDHTKPQILQTSGSYNLEWLLKEIKDAGDLTHPIKGNTVIFERQKYGGKFDRRVVRESTSIAKSEEDLNMIASQCIDLEKFFSKCDEEYEKKMRIGAASLQRHIEEKLLPMQAANTRNNYTEPTGTEDVDLTKPQAQTAPAPSQPAPSNPPAQGFNKVEVPVEKPADAPRCFGDMSVYDPNELKCKTCRAEFECSDAIAVQKANGNGAAQVQATKAPEPQKTEEPVKEQAPQQTASNTQVSPDFEEHIPF